MHALGALVPVLAEATSKPLVMISLAIVTGLYVMSEVLRLKGKPLPLITAFTLMMGRRDETEHFVTRPAYFALGIIASLLLFPTDIAYASITVVAVGDPAASYIGGSFGHTHIGSKTLEGFAAGMAASFAAASLWVSPGLALVGSGAGMLLELIGRVDDNLTMPIGAGAMMTLASILKTATGGM